MARNMNAEKGNRCHWDELAAVHAESYDCNRILSGGHLIDDIQLEEVGDVRDLSFLHLQCHIGTDTLSWAKLGAKVTGVDISPESIGVARKLSKESGLKGRFIKSSVYDLPEKLDETFDVVYTSVGVLCWLSDLSEWAKIVRGYLKPDGFFYVFDSHPVLGMLDDESQGLKIRYDYFHRVEPMKWQGGYQDYSNGDYTVKSPSWEWQWSLQDIVSSLIDAGLRMEFLREHEVIPWKALPSMVECGRDMWKLPDGFPRVPLMFSIRARPEE